MLIKLLRYEFKATGRIMLPLYLLLLLSATGLAADLRWSDDGKVQRFLTVFLLIVFVVAVIAVFITTGLLILVRFYRNLLKDEGYLMFSLPASTWQLIISKLLCALIWMICSLLVGLACGVIIERILGDGTTFYQQLRVSWAMFIGDWGKTGALRVFLIIAAVSILSILETVFKLFAALSVGQLWGSHRILGSVLAYIGFSIVETVGTQVLHLERFMPVVEETAVTGSNVAVEIRSVLANEILPYATWMIGISAVGILIYATITWFVLDRRLNLE